MRVTQPLAATLIALGLTAGGVLAALPVQAHEKHGLHVMASIKPVHALVAGVMEGVGEPGLIVEGAGSPHTYSLRPSKAHDLEHADIVFWIGPSLETFLERPLRSLARDAATIQLLEAPGVALLPFREGGPFEAHGHDHGDGHDHAHKDDHGHEDHGHDHGHAHDDDHGHGHAHDDGHGHDHGHAHDDGHDHGHAQAHDHGHDHGHDHSHEHGGIDAHIWLDPVNAKAMTRAIADALSAADPDHAGRYAANAARMEARLDALIDEMRGILEPVQHRPFIVFHDAYQYLEQRFGLEAAGSITVSPDVLPGARRVAEMQRKVGELGATCVFAEPQFEPRIVDVVTEGTPARGGVLDPLGADVPDGPDLYFTLMRNMATALHDCLSAAS